jgi:hypothetical protein
VSTNLSGTSFPKENVWKIIAIMQLYGPSERLVKYPYLDI